LKPVILVPGHEGAGATRNLATIEFMKKYIADWDKNVAASKSAARRLVEQGGVYVNGQRATAETDLASVKALAGRYHLLRKGARDYGLIRKK